MQQLCTVVITTRDRPEFAARAVTAALGQTAEVEVVVVDDGSMPPFAPQVVDPRLRVVRNEVPMGVNAARNRGLDAARGRWITFLDDDDVIVPRFVEVSLEAIARSSLPTPIAVQSGVQFVTVAGDPIGGESLYPVSVPKEGHHFLETHRIHRADQSFRTHNTLVVETEVLRKVGGWDAEIRAWVHNDLFLRLNAVCSLEAIDQVTYLLTRHSGTRRSTAMADTARGIERTLKKHAQVIDGYPVKRVALVDAAALGYLEGGARGDALRMGCRSIRLAPLRARSWAVLATVIGGNWAYRRLRSDRKA